MAYNYYTNFYFAGKKFVRFKSAPDDLHFISFLRSLIKYKIIYPNQRSGIKRIGWNCYSKTFLDLPLRVILR